MNQQTAMAARNANTFWGCCNSECETQEMDRAHLGSWLPNGG